MSGIHYLNSSLKQEYEADGQDNEWASLEAYFDLVQGSSSIERLMSTHEMAFSDARTRAKLPMSDAGRTFFLLRAANLSSNQIADIRMRVGGDL
jgi:head-tail adaptor